MHLVFLNQYYPPDAAPTGVMLEGVVGCLVKDGHEVTVLCASGGYAGVPTGREESAVSGGRLPVGENKTEDLAEESDSQPTANSQQPTDARQPVILRIGATGFGRGTFVGKVADYLSYYLGVAWKLMWLRPRPDRIVALTTPPYLSVLARVFSKPRGGDHAHWVMDLYPDVMVAHGMLRAGGMAHRLLAALARWGFGGRRCAAVLSLGPDMAERIDRLTGEGGGGGASAWVPLWSGAGDPDEADDRAVANRRHGMGWAEHEMVVMYSGNMGLGHRFGEILEVCGQGSGGVGDGGQEEAEAQAQSTSSTDHRSPITDHSLRFVFFGGGRRRGEIGAFVAAHPEAAVELHDYAPAEALPVHLRSADVHLASLSPEWTGTMVPSKLPGIFAAGRPVIFIGGAESSIGRWVRESGGGWVVAPGDIGGLRAALAEAGDADQRAGRGQRAAAFAKSRFDRQANVAAVAARLTADGRR